MIFDKDNWQEIFSALKKNKLRAVLTAFGVFWGVFMLIIMLGSGNGLQNGAIKDFKKIATNSVFIWPRQTTISYKGFPQGRRFRFNNDDIKALKDNIPEIKYIAPRNKLGGHRGINNVNRGEKNGAFSIYGDFPEIYFIKLMDITDGRFMNHLDLKEKRKVAVIGNRVYKILFGPGEKPIEKYIKIQGVHFKVVGVFNSKAVGDEEEEENQAIFIPFTTFQQAFNFGNRVSWFSLTSVKDVPVSKVEKKAIALLAARHHVAPNDTLAFGHWNTEKEFLKFVGLFRRIRILVWFVGTMTLIAGIIGVSNIMLVIVKERTREIGIRRAVGATPWKIISNIILESVLLTAFAGYFGLVAGVGMLETVSKGLKMFGRSTDMFQNPEVDFQIAVIALIVLIISGILAGMIPAHRAVSIKPVYAIRNA
ncbi:MAG: ABC transporter permease [Thermodesulfobacteriota bacterium]|nr:ABC transporter permease [Thermodesulfobacteriota bacterium]